MKELEGENTILAQITTKRRKFLKYEVEIRNTDCEGEIHFNSFIYLDMIFTLHNSLIHRKIGEVSNLEIRDKIDRKIKEMFCDK